MKSSLLCGLLRHIEHGYIETGYIHAFDARHCVSLSKWILTSSYIGCDDLNAKIILSFVPRTHTHTPMRMYEHINHYHDYYYKLAFPKHLFFGHFWKLIKSSNRKSLNIFIIMTPTHDFHDINGELLQINQFFSEMNYELEQF